jgi:hypothetical protein
MRVAWPRPLLALQESPDITSGGSGWFWMARYLTESAP